MSPSRLALLGALLLAVPGLRGGDPEGAGLLWEHAMASSGGDLTHPLFVDATREYARLRPWQDDFALGRERMRTVGAARLNRGD
ncbi:MAG: hypothetical protein EP330_00555 [Deltaproteobacteria bacterium]|nr:MAG: hypothetical protein EP330_00555 [Deltaproteobacteria bacterium]